MKNWIPFIMILAILGSASIVLAQGYKVGSKVEDFSLKNVDGSIVSLSDYSGEEGVVVIFTCNHCPYAIAYEDRIIDLHQKYSAKGYPVLAINPNDPNIQPDDSFEKMKERAEEKAFPFKYVFDENQEVYPKFGATRTPHCFLIDKDMRVRYIGAIDDNYKSAEAVEKTYLEDAIEALSSGKNPDPNFTKAIGCTIKAAK